MALTSISSRSFNQDVSQAKRAAEAGPVVITDRGRPAYVLMRHDDYQRLVGPSPSIVELLAQPEMADIEFDPPRLGPGVFKAADLT